MKFMTILIINLVFTRFVYADNKNIKCEYIFDVLPSKKINSYVVNNKTYFYTPCINKNGLCIKESYVLSGDILLINENNNYMCGAFLKDNYMLPLAVGWVKDESNLNKVALDEYNQLIGSWSNDSRDYVKTLEVMKDKENQSIYMNIQSTSTTTKNVDDQGVMYEGRVLKAGASNYIFISSDGGCIIDMKLDKDKLSLNTRSSCGYRNNYQDFSDVYAINPLAKKQEYIIHENQ